MSAYESDLADLADRSADRIEAEYFRAQAVSETGAQSYDILMLSGGGAFGAFGAGFLEGWGAVSDSEFRRPEFDTVSGISTGALIAPLAFIGSNEAYSEVLDIYQNPPEDLVKSRGLIPFLPGRSSLLNVDRLRDQIRDVVTPELVRGLAEGSRNNRQLLIGATNIDYGLLRVWDLARTAAELDEEQAAEQIRAVLSASSAIPSAFPPVEIDDMLYVDGGATMQIIGGIDQRAWAYIPNPDNPDYVASDHLIRLRVWVLVNQKLLLDPELVELRWPQIGSRSMSALLRTSTLQSLQDAETYVRLINQIPSFDARFYYVAIPEDYDIRDTGEMFDAETMRELADLGERMGADPESWRTEALRPGAPFQAD